MGGQSFLSLRRSNSVTLLSHEMQVNKVQCLSFFSLKWEQDIIISEIFFLQIAVFCKDLLLITISQVLSEELPGAIAKISFPKSMRWNSEVYSSVATLVCFTIVLFVLVRGLHIYKLFQYGNFCHLSLALQLIMMQSLFHVIL